MGTYLASIENKMYKSRIGGGQDYGEYSALREIRYGTSCRPYDLSVHAWHALPHGGEHSRTPLRRFYAGHPEILTSQPSIFIGDHPTRVSEEVKTEEQLVVVEVVPIMPIQQ